MMWIPERGMEIQTGSFRRLLNSWVRMESKLYWENSKRESVLRDHEPFRAYPWGFIVNLILTGNREPPNVSKNKVA